MGQIKSKLIMACKYKYNNNWYSKEELKSILLKEKGILPDGKLVKPEIEFLKNSTKFLAIETSAYGDRNNHIFNSEKEALDFKKRVDSEGDWAVEIVKLGGKQPTQTKENTTSIDSVKDKIVKQDVIFGEPFKKSDKEFRFEYFVNENRFELNEIERLVENGIPRRLRRVSVQEALEIGISENFVEQQKENLKNKVNKEKEYTSQAETNLKVAALKEVARKYPRSLITSKVVPINPYLVDNSNIKYSKLGSKQDIEGFEQYLTLNINSEIQKNDGILQQTLENFYSSLSQDQLSKIPSIEQVKEEIVESIYDDSDIIEMLKCKI